jgi:peptidoglycan-associated lipoprotein
MKANSFTTLMALGIALSFIATGCKNPENMETIYGRRTPPQDITGPGPIPGDHVAGDTNGMIAESDTQNHTNWIAHPEQFAADTVHFAYDSSVVRSADKSKVSEVADYLKGNGQTAVRVEGNCDERGTEEYNRSLGERRALAVREELVRLGITPDRVDTISYGEDKPVATGHNEDAWKQNRRGDFVLLTPPAGGAAAPSAPAPMMETPSTPAPATPPPSTPPAQ